MKPSRDASSVIPSRRSDRRPGPTHVLEPGEVRNFLSRIGWGVLATATGDGPYAVPVSYGFDGQCIYFGTGAGKKLAALERDPRVCLTVTEVAGTGAWTSVVAIGRVEWLNDLPSRIRAIRTLAHQDRPGDRLGAQDAGRLLRARLARLKIEELTGRTRG